MPRKNITLELGGRTIRFDDLRAVPMTRLAAYWQQQVEQGGIWRCDEGHEGHLAASIYPDHPPFFRHNAAGCTTCAPDEEPAGESAEHKTAKRAIADDLEHIGLTVDEECTWTDAQGNRHRFDVAARDKRNQLWIVEPQRSYEPIQHLHMRDKARTEATGTPDRVLWVTDVERARWNGHPLIVCDREFSRTRNGLWSHKAMDPDNDQPLEIERGELLERWTAGQVNRIQFPERPTPIGPETQWMDRSGGTPAPRKRRRSRKPTDAPARATVCVPCDLCGARVTVSIDTAASATCASCVAAIEQRRQTPTASSVPAVRSDGRKFSYWLTELVQGEAARKAAR